jgi:hypothetical protein
MPSPKFVSKEHKTAIGELVVIWAQLELHVIKGLSRQLNAGIARTAIVFWHMSHKERMTRLATLFYLDHPDKNSVIRKEFDTLLRRIALAYDIRNMLVHSIWEEGTIAKSIKPFFVSGQRYRCKIPWKRA